MNENRIRELREARGLKQEELAGLAGIRQGTLSNLENGKRTYPRADNAVRLAEVLDVSVEYLIGFSDDPRRRSDAGKEAAKPAGFALTENEKRLVEDFRALSPQLRVHQLEVVHELAMVAEARKQAK